MPERIDPVFPVFSTAPMTLFRVASAGDRDAVRLADQLSLTPEGTKAGATPEETLNNEIIPATRFRTIQRLNGNLTNIFGSL